VLKRGAEAPQRKWIRPPEPAFRSSKPLEKWGEVMRLRLALWRLEKEGEAQRGALRARS
jgi:hypothetical protein